MMKSLDAYYHRYPTACTIVGFWCFMALLCIAVAPAQIGWGLVTVSMMTGSALALIAGVYILGRIGQGCHWLMKAAWRALPARVRDLCVLTGQVVVVLIVLACLLYQVVLFIYSPSQWWVNTKRFIEDSVRLFQESVKCECGCTPDGKSLVEMCF